MGARFESRSLVLGVMLIFLVDPLWGSIWRAFMGWPGKPEDGRRPFWLGWRLPYRVPGAPADVLSRLAKNLRLSEAYSSGVFESTVVAIVFALVISFAIDRMAVAATVAVFLLSVLAAAVKGSNRSVALLAGMVFFAAPFYLALVVLGHPGKEAMALGALWFPVYVLRSNLHFDGGRLLLAVPSAIAGSYLLWLHVVFGAVLVFFSALPLVASEDEGRRVPFYLLLSLIVASLVVGYGL